MLIANSDRLFNGRGCQFPGSPPLSASFAPPQRRSDATKLTGSFQEVPPAVKPEHADVYRTARASAASDRRAERRRRGGEAITGQCDFPIIEP